jgi:putative ABC transport system permease protein
MVWSQFQSNRDIGKAVVGPRTFLEWKRQATAFEDLEAWSWRSVNISTNDRPEQVQAGPASPGFLPMLGYGQPLALGRNFLEQEGTVGRDQVVILSHRLWRERFGAAPDIIGRPIRIDRRPYTVVGVLRPGPPDHNQTQLWVPLAVNAEQLEQDSHSLLVVGRLKSGVTLEQANANMAAISRGLAKAYPAASAGWSASIEPFRNNFLSNDTKRGLWLLLGAVALVLLIACANVANLLLARGSTRQRELAIRSSLGASRPQIIRQLLAESVVLALMGGALGVALASGLISTVIALMPPFMLPTEAHIRLNVPVLLVALATCAASGMLFGAAPAWQAARVDVNATLKESSRSVGGGGYRLRHVLVGLEFALALTLLAAGGVAIHSLFTLANRDLGFRTTRLLTFAVPVPDDRFSGAEQIGGFYRELIERVGALPGVISVSVSTGMPLRDWGGIQFSVAGKPVDDASQRPVAGISMVTPAYFRTFDLRITRGRAFTEQDRAGGVPVTIVNETFVRQFLGHVDPLMQRLVFPRVTPGSA